MAMPYISKNQNVMNTLNEEILPLLEAGDTINYNELVNQIRLKYFISDERAKEYIKMFIQLNGLTEIHKIVLNQK